MRVTDKKTIKAMPLGPCPCGGEISASVNPPAVVHSVPYCQKFQDLDAKAFLSYVRRARGLPDPTG